MKTLVKMAIGIALLSLISINTKKRKQNLLPKTA